MRGGGNQAFHIGSVFAAMSALTAVLQREVSGRGQFIDVSMHAAANVTTESGSFDWLVAQSTVIRQTGRHALATVTQETQVECVDGRYVNTGFPPRHAKDYASLRDWVDELGFRDSSTRSCSSISPSNAAASRSPTLREDPLIAEIYGAGRSALVFLAEHLTPEEFFVGAQQRGIAVGAVWSPEEAFDERALRRTRLPGGGRARGHRPHDPLPGRAVHRAEVALAHLPPPTAHR